MTAQAGEPATIRLAARYEPFDLPASGFTMFFDTETCGFAYRVSCLAIHRAVTDDIARVLPSGAISHQIEVERAISEAEIAAFGKGLDGDWPRDDRSIRPRMAAAETLTR